MPTITVRTRPLRHRVRRTEPATYSGPGTIQPYGVDIDGHRVPWAHIASVTVTPGPLPWAGTR